MAYRYWVGDGGSWWSTAHWSTTSGGSSGASVPTNADTAYFDANSFNSTGQTIDCGNTKLTVLDLQMWDLDQNITMNNVNGISVYGSLELSSWVTLTGTTYIYMEGSSVGGEYIDFTAISNFNMGLWTNSNKAWTLYGGTTTGTFHHDNGTLNCSGGMIVSNFTTSGSNAKTLNMNTYTIYCTAQWDANYANFTFNAGTGTIAITGGSNFFSGGKTYNIVDCQATTYIFNTGATIRQLKVSNYMYVSFNTGITTTINDMNLGASVTLSSYNGTAAIITYTGTYITAKGAGCVLSNGLTINTTNAPANRRYWIGGSGYWNQALYWSTISGFLPCGGVPTSTDSVYFDSKSFTTTGQTVAFPSACYCNDMDFTGVTNSPTLDGSFYYPLNIYGSMTLATGVSVTSGVMLKFVSTTTGETITTSGVSLQYVEFSGTGSWTLQDDFTVAVGNTLYLKSGTLNTNGKTVTCPVFGLSATSNTRWLNLSSSTIICNSGSTTVWDASAPNGLILNAGTSTIKVPTSLSVFAGGGKDYYNVEVSGDFSTITGNWNSFNTLKLTAGNTISLESGSGQTIKMLEGDGTSDSVLITLKSTVAGTPCVIYKANGLVTKRYYSIKDCTLSGNAVFKAIRSVNVSGNTGWIFPKSPALKYYNGSIWVDTNDLGNCDTVDGMNFRVDSGRLQFSYNGTTWIYV